MSSDFNAAEFSSLLNKLREGELSEGRIRELRQYVSESAEARKRYFEYMFLVSALRWTFSPTNDFAEPPVEEVVLNAATSAKVGSPEVEIQLHEILATPARKEPQESPVLGFLGRASALFTTPVLWSVFFFAAICYGTFAVIAWNLRDGKSPNVAAKHESIPQNVEGAAKDENSPIKRDRQFVLERGQRRLKLKQGVILTIEGPAEWSIMDDNRVKLQLGKLLANVPTEAIGFTVETPTAKVVDLGTEFGVDVAEDQTSEVQTFVGKVVVQLKQVPTQLVSKSATEVSAGQAVRVTKQAITAISITDAQKLSFQNNRSALSARGEPPVERRTLTERIAAIQDNPNLVALYVGGMQAERKNQYINLAKQGSSDWNGHLKYNNVQKAPKQRGPMWVITPERNSPSLQAYALMFDGVDDYLSFSKGSFGKQFTLSLWVRPQKFTAGRQTLLANMGLSSGENGFVWGIGDAHTAPHEQGQMAFRVLHNEQRALLAKTSSILLRTHVWQHLVAVVDTEQGAVRLYHNGQLVSHRPDSYYSPSQIAQMEAKYPEREAALVQQEDVAGFCTSSPWRFGTTTNNMGFYSGLLDELAIFNCMLTEQEISELSK